MPTQKTPTTEELLRRATEIRAEGEKKALALELRAELQRVVSAELLPAYEALEDAQGDLVKLLRQQKGDGNSLLPYMRKVNEAAAQYSQAATGAVAAIEQNPERYASAVDAGNIDGMPDLLGDGGGKGGKAKAPRITAGDVPITRDASVLNSTDLAPIVQAYVECYAVAAGDGDKRIHTEGTRLEFWQKSFAPTLGTPMQALATAMPDYENRPMTSEDLATKKAGAWKSLATTVLRLQTWWAESIANANSPTTEQDAETEPAEMPPSAPQPAEPVAPVVPPVVVLPANTQPEDALSVPKPPEPVSPVEPEAQPTAAAPPLVVPEPIEPAPDPTLQSSQPTAEAQPPATAPVGEPLPNSVAATPAPLVEPLTVPPVAAPPPPAVADSNPAADANPILADDLGGDDESYFADDDDDDDDDGYDDDDEDEDEDGEYDSLGNLVEGGIIDHDEPMVLQEKPDLPEGAKADWEGDFPDPLTAEQYAALDDEADAVNGAQTDNVSNVSAAPVAEPREPETPNPVPPSPVVASPPTDEYAEKRQLLFQVANDPGKPASIRVAAQLHASGASLAEVVTLTHEALLATADDPNQYLLPLASGAHAQLPITIYQDLVATTQINSGVLVRNNTNDPMDASVLQQILVSILRDS